ncbi:MAG TPA: hypothetical protein PL051_03350 [Candidatus Saccharibacteria bacterium]|nr:hypothetical protein [Candidatus Saccharibacteria bacterium]
MAQKSGEDLFEQPMIPDFDLDGFDFDGESAQLYSEAREAALTTLVGSLGDLDLDQIEALQRVVDGFNSDEGEDGQ